MKLLLLCSTPEWTGPAELMLDDAATLRDAGHEVTLAIDTRRPGTLRPRLEAAGFRLEAGLDLCRQARPGRIARDVLHLREAIGAGRFDTFHARFAHDHHLLLLATAGLDRTRLRLLRSCELMHGIRPGTARTLPFRRTDTFAVPSAAHAAALVDGHGISPERVVLLPGRVDSARFSPGPSGLRTELGIPADAPVVGIVSRVKPDRLHAKLVEAFARARTLVPSAVLVVVGRGEGLATVAAAVEEAGISSATRFAGYRTGEALVDAYRALDVKAWLAPGNDGTCRAVLEAMACGAAILGGRFGAVEEAVVDGETGRLCDPSDTASTGSILAELLGDLPRTRKLGEAGRRRAVAVYTPAHRAEAALALYARAWAAPPAGTSG